MQTTKSSYSFKLTLKERRPFFTVFLASFVTAHVVMPSDESVEAVIHAYDERTKSQTLETTESAKPPAWLKELVEKSFDEPTEYKIPTLETPDPKAGEPITRGFVVQPKHQKVLLKMFRQGLIQLFEPLSHVPVDPEIGDFFLRDAKLSFDDFVKFANEIGIDVSVGTDLTDLTYAGQQPVQGISKNGKAVSNSSKVDKALSPKSNTAMLNVIGGLLEIVLSGKVTKNANQEWLIKSLLEAHPRVTGLSRSNLSSLFPKAKKSLDGS